MKANIKGPKEGVKVVGSLSFDKDREAVVEAPKRTIHNWGKFREEFKKDFFPNNVIYEANCKFRKLK